MDKAIESKASDRLAMIRAAIPTPEQMAESLRRRLDAARNNPTCFTHWFPAVERLNIPHPRSQVIDFPYALTGALLNEKFDAVDDQLKVIVTQIRTFGEQVGYPMFMKNNLFSGKHSWLSTCFISEQASDQDIMGQIINLTHFWACVSGDIALHLVVREFIPTQAIFHAFGGMPVTAEYRLFATEGRLNGWQPYWPQGAIQQPDVEDWQSRLKTIEEPSSEEMAKMRTWAEAITRELGGYWSVDFLRDRDGQLWLIDMAEGDKSYHCPEGYRSVDN